MIPAVPRATYRLQLTKDFGFDDAAALAPYLKDLGISHLYASPFLKARRNAAAGDSGVNEGPAVPAVALISERRPTHAFSAHSRVSGNPVLLLGPRFRGDERSNPRKS